MVARVFKGLDPEQMVACGGKTMPKDEQGRMLSSDSHAFGAWVKDQVRAHREDQLSALTDSERALQASLAEAQRQVELFSLQIVKNAKRQAEIRARPRV